MNDDTIYTENIQDSTSLVDLSMKLEDMLLIMIPDDWQPEDNADYMWAIFAGDAEEVRREAFVSWFLSMSKEDQNAEFSRLMTEIKREVFG